MRPDLFENAPAVPRSSSMLPGPCLHIGKRYLLELCNAILPVADIRAELMRLHAELSLKEMRAYFRDIQDHVSGLLGQIDGIRDMLTRAIQVRLALVAHNQNEVKRLAGGLKRAAERSTLDTQAFWVAAQPPHLREVSFKSE